MFSINQEGLIYSVVLAASAIGAWLCGHYYTDGGPTFDYIVCTTVFHVIAFPLGVAVYYIGPFHLTGLNPPGQAWIVAMFIATSINAYFLGHLLAATRRRWIPAKPN